MSAFGKMPDTMNDQIFPAGSASRELRDLQSGMGAAMAKIPVPELVAIVDMDVRSRFSSLTNDVQRRGFLDAIVGKLDGSIDGWAKIYAAAAILEEQQDYWLSQGYASFASFWREKAGPIFGAMKELEDLFQYARIACPSMFLCDPLSEDGITARLESLRLAVSAMEHHSPSLPRKRVFESIDEARAFVAVALQWELASNRSIQYRMYRIKRDRPDIAARLLAGEYFVTLPSGLIGIDIGRAENEVFGGGSKIQRRPRTGTQDQTQHSAAAELQNDIDGELDHVLRNAEEFDSVREHVIERFKKVPWLVAAIAESR